MVPLHDRPDEEKIRRIIEKTIEFLESGWRVSLEPPLLERILDVLQRVASKVGGDWVEEVRRLSLLPEAAMKKLLEAPAGAPLTLESLVDRLASWERMARPGVTMLGAVLCGPWRLRGLTTKSSWRRSSAANSSCPTSAARSADGWSCVRSA